MKISSNYDSLIIDIYLYVSIHIPLLNYLYTLNLSFFRNVNFISMVLKSLQARRFVPAK